LVADKEDDGMHRTDSIDLVIVVDVESSVG